MFRIDMLIVGTICELSYKSHRMRCPDLLLLLLETFTEFACKDQRNVWDVQNIRWLRHKQAEKWINE